MNLDEKLIFSYKIFQNNSISVGHETLSIVNYELLKSIIEVLRSHDYHACQSIAINVYHLV